MKTKGAPYWILLLTSAAISVLLISQIFISRAIIHEQHFLVDQREAADAGPYYREAWHKLAVDVWQGSAQDPALLALLKSEGIGVHEGPPPGTPGAPGAAPVPTTPPANPDAAPHPATP